MEKELGAEGNKPIQWYCEDCKSSDEEEPSDEPVEEPEPVEKFKTITLSAVR